MPAYDEPEQEAPQRYRDEPPRRARRPDPYFAAAEPPFQRREPYHMASAVEEPVDDVSPHHAGPASGYRQEPHFDDAEDYRQDDDRQYHDDRQYQDDRQYPVASRMQEPYFDLGEPVTEQDDEMYDDPPPKRGRGGLITAVTLIGCAMIGTAGAYGYRTYYVAPNERVPPVITAETTPNKVVSAGDVQTGKTIQARVGDQVQGERVISREEQPVAIPPGPGAPRVVLPGPGAASQSGFPPPPAAGIPPSVAGTSPSGGGEPRRVRTVTIRPDGTDTAGKAVGGVQGGAPRTAPAAKSTGRNTAPLQLDPETSAQAQPAPAPSPRSERVAAAPATTQSLQPPAPRAPAASGAGYLVQVSSQRSEAEAQASYRALQAKYPDQLDGQSMVVKRVDLGDKGVYYRALVGPFASSTEAVQFCTDFKAAGGQCLVPRN